ncbi:MAG: ChbG/HpnK family deacetylase [Sedimentisphaerales bacterium]
MDTWSSGKNEPKTNPNEPNTKPNKANFSANIMLSDVLNINRFTPRNGQGNSRPDPLKPDCFCYLCRLNLIMMDRRIIINADDFGLCDGVNEAVARAHSDGILTSATIMVNMPAAEKAVKIAKKLPSLGVGVHLNLNEGQPISKDPGIDRLLDSDGQFAHSPLKLSLLSLAGHKIREAIRTELAAQIQWVIDHGLKPTHLDSHKHIHSFPALFSIVCQSARRFQISAIRWTFEPKELSRIPWPMTSEEGRIRAIKVRIMAKINRMQNKDFLKNDVLLGIAHTGRIDVNFFKAVTLYNSAATVEVMTHPGFIDGLDADKTRLLHQRKVELDALCSEKTRQYFKDAGIKLVHYGQL